MLQQAMEIIMKKKIIALILAVLFVGNACGMETPQSDYAENYSKWFSKEQREVAMQRQSTATELARLVQKDSTGKYQDVDKKYATELDEMLTRNWDRMEARRADKTHYGQHTTIGSFPLATERN